MCMYVCTFILQRLLSVAMMVVRCLSGESTCKPSKQFPDTFRIPRDDYNNNVWNKRSNIVNNIMLA